MPVLVSSDRLPINPETAQNDTYWTVANLSGSLFTTGWQSLAVDNSPSDVDYIFTKNLPSNPLGEGPVAGFWFPASSVPTAQAQWRLRLRVKLTAPYVGANTLTCYLSVDPSSEAGFSTIQAPYRIENTPTPGSWVTIDIDFGPTRDLNQYGLNGQVTLRFNNYDVFPMEFRITHLQLFSLGPGYVAAPENDVALNFNYLLHDVNEHGKSVDG